MGLLDQLFPQLAPGPFGGDYPSSLFVRPDLTQEANEAAARRIAAFARRRPVDQQAAPSIFDTGGAAFSGFEPGASVPAQPMPATIPGGLPGLAPQVGLPAQPAIQLAPAPIAPPAAATPAAPAAAGPSRYMSIGDYQMPVFGEPDPAQLPVNARPTQGMMPQQAPQPQSPDFGDRLMAGFQNFANAGGLLPAVAGGISGFATGQRTDPAGVQLQSQRAIYEAALASGLDKNRAFLVATNPKAFEAYSQQLLGPKDPPKTYEELEVRNAWENRNNPGAAAAGLPNTVTGPDGKPVQIPPGVDRKTFVNEISRANAKAAAGEKTEVQANSESFANRMELAQKNVAQLETEGTSITGALLGTIPGGNLAQSAKYQKYQQAKSNFITALLRRESGAAIGKEEFNRYDREFFPQPGDVPEVIAQKAQARQVAVDAMKRSAGPGYKPPSLEMDVGQSRTVNGVTIKRIN